MRKQSVPFCPEGFTLLELLIAFAIMSAVLTALYYTFFLSQRALVTVDESLLKLQESRSFVDTLKREIESVLYSPDNSYSVFKMDDRDFYGRQTSRLVMTSLSPLINGTARITYSVEERDGKLVITKEMAPALSQPSESRNFDLLEDVESFTMEGKYEDRWVKTWDSASAKGVPDEVRISVTLFLTNSEKQNRTGVPFSISDIAKPRIGKNL
ncbi:MAG: prepilin-type N-terminal cleavage/methylation domain-containing protein [Syntrophales bacterium]|nr:prepilin-type N-terminal cleavage/methylation domain-containing protein [Syntrophales bacterium]